MVTTLTLQNQSKPMFEVLAMDRSSRSDIDGASITRRELIAARVVRHRAEMLDVSKLYFGLGKRQASKDSSNASCT